MRIVSHSDNLENGDLSQTHNRDKNNFVYSKFGIYTNFVVLYFSNSVSIFFVFIPTPFQSRHHVKMLDIQHTSEEKIV